MKFHSNCKIVLFSVLRLFLVVSFIFMFYVIISTYNSIPKFLSSPEYLILFTPIPLFIILLLIVIISLFRIKKTSIVNRVTRYIFQSALLYCLIILILFNFIKYLSQNLEDGRCSDMGRYYLNVELKKNSLFFITDNHDKLIFDSFHFGWYKKSNNSISFFQLFPYPNIFKGEIQYEFENPEAFQHCSCLYPHGENNYSYLLSLTGFAHDCIGMKNSNL